VWRRARAASGTEAEAQTEAIVAEISASEIGGQVAVGSHNLQIRADHGAIVYAMPPGEAPSVRPRPRPVVLQPRDFPRLLGRERELEEVRRALAEGETVGVTAPPGGGKTSLLRRLSHLAAGTLEHGVVFVRAAGQPREDVERFLFDAFFECDAPYQPTPFELRQRLAECRALVVLDDLDQERDDVCELLDCVPGCRFLLASERRGLWGEERTLELRGLDGAAALALLERELDRPLRDDERARASELCRRLGGRPLSVLQAAALARTGELPLGAPGELEESLRAGLDDEERRVLRALELLTPAAVHVDDVAAIAGVPDAAAVLERLRERGAAQAHSPRWSVTLTLRLGGGEDGDGGEDALLLRRARERLAADADERPVEDVAVVLAALRAGDGRPADRRDALTLARAADPLLTRSGRWGAWRVALERARVAAEAGGDRAAAAWALHQLGTSAGCLGDRGGAASLKRALALRRELGDEVGAAVSAHNLAQLFGPPPGGGGGQGNGGALDGPPRTGLWLALGGGVLALGVAAALLLGGNDSSPGSAEPVAVTTTQTQPRVTTTVPPITRTVPPTTTSTPPRPKPAATELGIDGKFSYLADADKGSMYVFNRGPAAIAIVPSIDSPRFRTLVDCPPTLAVRQSCQIIIVYHAGPQEVQATLSFANSPTTVRLFGEAMSTPPDTTTTTPPVTTSAAPATTTSGEAVIVR
jgi:hypothetical protein